MGPTGGLLHTQAQCKKSKASSTVLRAPSSVGRRNSMRVAEGTKEKKGLKSCRDKIGGVCDSGEGGGEPA